MWIKLKERCNSAKGLGDKSGWKEEKKRLMGKYMEEKSNETNTRQLIGYDNNAKIIYV